MIWLSKPDQPKTTEFTPAMDEGTGILPGLPAIAGKPVHVTFDGGLMTSDAGILPLAPPEQRLLIPERLANCIEAPRAPERVRHTLTEMIRYRALLVAAGYPDGKDCCLILCGADQVQFPDIYLYLIAPRYRRVVRAPFLLR